MSVTLRNIGKVIVKVTQGEVHIRQYTPVSTRMDDDIELRLSLSKDFENFENVDVARDAVKHLDSQLDWQLVGLSLKTWKEGEFEIEPGENDSYQFDFVLKPNITQIIVYTYFLNEKKKKNIGWDFESLYSIE